MASLKKLKEKYLAGEKLVALTGYDALMSSILADAGVDFILVGDSLSNVIAGYDNTLPITMEQMLWHTQMTVRGAKGVPVVADMPFMSYEISVEQALVNAGRFIKEGGADAVKLEGGRAAYHTIRALTEAHIPVCGHVGLQPQSVLALGGYSVQGKDKETARKIKEDALAVQEAGAFAVVLEMIPSDLAAEISSSLKIPTIGIGAGPFCAGQVLVTHDLLGMTENKMKIVKRYAYLRKKAVESLQEYISDVKNGITPSKENCF